MPASTPTLDRLIAGSLRLTAETRDEIPEASTEDEAGDDVLALAYTAAELTVPRVTPDNFVLALDVIAESFVELARIVFSEDEAGGEARVRQIIAAAAIQTARPHDDVEAFRTSLIFFLVNVPGGTLDAAFELVMGLTDEDFENFDRS